MDMDSPRTTDTQQQAEVVSLGNGMVSTIARAPLSLFLAVLSNGFAALRPFAPQLIPILLCILLIPLVVLLSVSAGFVVWKGVATGWESPIHLQYGDGIPPYALATLPKLVSQQRYDISLHLTIPATENNFVLGNFMSTLTLTTPSNKTLASIRRPAIVFPPQTTFFRRKPSSISLTVPMLSSFITGSSKVVAYVEIGRRDSWAGIGSGEGREISVIAASVRGVLVHHGIRGLVSRFPLTFAFISSATFLVILSLILGACLLPAVLRPRPQENTGNQPSKDLPFSSLSTPSSDVDDKPLRRRRRSRPSRSTSRRTGVKLEVPVASVPPPATNFDPLRRRPSRPFQRLSESES